MSSVAGVGAGAAADVSRRGRTGPSSSRRGDLLRSAASSAESSSSFLSRRGGAASSGGSSAALGPVVVGAGVAGVVVRSLFVDVVGASCACGNAGALVEVVGTDVVCVSPVVVGATGVGSGIVGGVVESSSVWVPSRSRSRSPSSFSRCLFAAVVAGGAGVTLPRGCGRSLLRLRSLSLSPPIVESAAAKSNV